MIRLVALAALLAVTSASAGTVPHPGSGDRHVQSIEYDPEQIITLQVAPGYQLTIQFSPDERIDNVALGNSAAWQAMPNRRGDYLFVKAMQGGIPSNLTVVTDARVYNFELVPAFGQKADLPYFLKLEYRPSTDANARPDPKGPRTSYRIRGKASVRPTEVFDDGAFTYISWPDTTALPAVFAVDAQGKEALINGTMRGSFFVIDTVSPRLIFRHGRALAIGVRKADR